MAIGIKLVIFIELWTVGTLHCSRWYIMLPFCRQLMRTILRQVNTSQKHQAHESLAMFASSLSQIHLQMQFKTVARSLTLANNTRPVKAYWDLHLHCHRFEHKGDSKPLCFWVRARGGKELVRRRWSQLMWANCWRSSLEYVVVIIPGPASNTPLPTASPSEWLPPQVTQDLTPLPLVKEEMFRKVYMHVHVLSTVRLISFIVQAGIDSLTLKINYVLQTHEIALKDLTSKRK